MTPRIQTGVGARLQKDTLDAVRRWSSDARGHCRTGKTLPEVWRKNNKALIKAENLKGLLRYRAGELFGYTSAILKIKDEKIC